MADVEWFVTRRRSALPDCVEFSLAGGGLEVYLSMLYVLLVFISFVIVLGF